MDIHMLNIFPLKVIDVARGWIGPGRDKYRIGTVFMGICDKIVVLSFGTKIAEGSPQEIQVNKDVIVAYLGVSE